MCNTDTRDVAATVQTAGAGARETRDTRERILEAALATFSEHGFDGATTREIVASGTAQPRATFRFRSEDLDDGVHHLTWQIAGIEPGQGVLGGFQLRSTGLAMGELITATAGADSAATPLVTAGR